MIIKSLAYLSEGFAIPPFELNRGEVIVLRQANTSQAQERKMDMISYLSRTKPHQGIEVYQSLKYAPHISMRGWKERYFP